MEEKNRGEPKKNMDIEKKKDAQKDVNEPIENIEEDDDDFEDFEVDGKIFKPGC
jgi:hypothetical protein